MNSGAYKTLYQAFDFPVFQNRMYSSAEEARNCPKGDLRIVEDQETGLVFNAAFQPERVDYDANYQNEQAVSPLFKKHLGQVAGLVGEYLGKDSLIEVGCGKGYFLNMLWRQGFNITGFDPTFEGDNERVRKEYFSEDNGFEAKGLILRHVLEHIADPVSFLQSLKLANGGQGLIYIEVPCFDWICERRAWFDIFYEHVNYFRLSDFYRMFDNVHSAGRIFGDQYLYVVADLASLKTPVLNPGDAMSFPNDFMRSLDCSQHSTAQHSTAQHSTAQHSTAQHSTAQHSAAQLLCLGWGIKRRHLFAATGASRLPGHHCDRCQPGQARQVPPGNWTQSRVTIRRTQQVAGRLDNLCHEFQLS